MESLSVMWTALTAPGEVPLLGRLQWTVLSVVVLAFAGFLVAHVWVGQSRRDVYYPAERAALALAYALLLAGYVVVLLPLVGWWFGAQTRWADLWVPGLVALALAVFVWLLRPGRPQSA